GRWRWAFFDLDWGMGRQMPDNIDIDPSTFNMMEFVTQDKEEMTLFREIIKNEKLQQRFIEIMLSLLKHEYPTQNVTQKIDETAAMIRPEMEQSIYRWENIESMEKWEENLNVLYDFAEKRPNAVKEHIIDKFDLTEEDLRTIEDTIE